MASKTKKNPPYNLLEKIRVNENIAMYLRYGTLEDRKKAIQLYEENIKLYEVNVNEMALSDNTYNKLVKIYGLRKK